MIVSGKYVPKLGVLRTRRVHEIFAAWGLPFTT